MPYILFIPSLSLSLPLSFSVDIRKEEKLLLEKAGYTQSVNSSLTAIVPSLATILTFIAHTALRLPLQPSTVSQKVQRPTELLLNTAAIKKHSCDPRLPLMMLM